MNNGECTLIHLTIEDYVSSDEDLILRQAHREFQKIGFDNPDEVITIETSDALDQAQSRRRRMQAEDEEDEDWMAYLATSLVYEQANANLKWRIVVVVPLQENTEDSITSDEGELYIFYLASLIVIWYLLNHILMLMTHDQTTFRSNHQVSSA